MWKRRKNSSIRHPSPSANMTAAYPDKRMAIDPLADPDTVYQGTGSYRGSQRASPRPLEKRTENSISVLNLASVSPSCPWLIDGFLTSPSALHTAWWNSSAACKKTWECPGVSRSESSPWPAAPLEALNRPETASLTRTPASVHAPRWVIHSLKNMTGLIASVRYQHTR